MLDAYDKPDCAMEAAMVKVLNDNFAFLKLPCHLCSFVISRFLALRAYGIVRANVFKF